MNPHDQLQIEMAANGSVSGYLREWPDLNSALVRLGIHLHPLTLAPTLRIICKMIMMSRECDRLDEITTRWFDVKRRLTNITEPIGNCDGSGRYAFDPAREDGHGALLAKPCPGCRACR